MRTHNLYLLRHGRTVGKPALNGKTDVKVDPAHQFSIAQALKSFGVPYSSVITSPLSRCADLAKLLETPNAKVTVNPQLAEMDFGEFDGVPFDELHARWSELERFWLSPASCQFKDAESLETFYHRVKEGWGQIVGELESDTLVIAHGGVIRMILALELDLDWHNPKWFSTLNIGHHSLTHITVSGVEKYKLIKTIGQPLKVEEQ